MYRKLRRQLGSYFYSSLWRIKKFHKMFVFGVRGGADEEATVAVGCWTIALWAALLTRPSVAGHRSMLVSGHERQVPSLPTSGASYITWHPSLSETRLIKTRCCWTSATTVTVPRLHDSHLKKHQHPGDDSFSEPLVLGLLIYFEIPTYCIPCWMYEISRGIYWFWRQFRKRTSSLYLMTGTRMSTQTSTSNGQERWEQLASAKP